MTKIQFFPIDFSYETHPNGKPIMQIFGKTLDGRKVCIFDQNFLPYFYAIIKSNIDDALDKILGINIVNKDESYYVIEAQIEQLKFNNKNVKSIKITVNHPKSIKVVRKFIEDHFNNIDFAESDITFVRRYILDKKITPLSLAEVDGDIIERSNLAIDFGVKINSIRNIGSEFFDNAKILSFDIEAYTQEKRYPIKEKDPIVMIAFYGNDGFKKVITWKRFPHSKDMIEFVEDEPSLLRRFASVINEYRPDYIVGYFTDGFDFPYIKTRAKKYEVKLNFRNSGLKIIKRGNFGSARIKGITHLDIFRFIKAIMSGSLRLENYSLGTVASELLNEKKLDTNIEDIGLAWDESPELLEKFCEYNLKDAELTLKIFEKILPNLNEIVKLVDMPIYDVCRMGYSQLVDSYLVKRAREYKELCPNKPDYGLISERRIKTYKGAFVFNPVPKLYHNLVVFDFQSLYPSIIVTHNISPITLVSEDGITTPEIELEDGRKVFYHFSKEEGFIPAVMRDIIIRRGRVKELLREDKYNPILDARSYALKTIMNATYGYFGFFGARWYSKESAEAITAYGRKYIQDVITEAQKNDFEVIYSDTDSIFMHLANKTKEDSLTFLEKINDKLPGLMELELENFYVRGIFVMKKSEATGAKKKYALISEDGRIKVRGFETIRRDWSPIAREVQREVLSIILKDNSPEKAFEYVKQTITDIRNKKIEKEKMIIQTQLKKNIENYDLQSPHVSVAKRMKELGHYVVPGSIINYIVTPGKGRIKDRSMLPDEAEDYDSEYYTNNQIIPVVDKIFDALGYNVEELLKDKEQSNLKSFFKK
ncbi:MAG: DNA-directed DNA polymerase [Nanoarchaeota archaeon]